MVQRYAKTDAGQEVIKTRSVSLSPRQRTLLLLCDGKRDEAQLLRDTAGLGVTLQDLAALLSLGLISSDGEIAAPPDLPPRPIPPVTAAPVPAAAAPAESPSALSSDLSAAERYRLAYPVATRLTAALGLFGMRLQLEVERCSTVEALQALYPRMAEAAAKHPKARDELATLRLALGMD